MENTLASKNTQIALKAVFVFLIAIFLFSCNSESGKLDINIDDISIKPVHIKRYGQALFNIDKEHLKSELGKLQKEFPAFIGDDLVDTIKLMKVSNFINDPLLIDAAKECNKKFPDLSFLEDELTEAFKHLKYYFPDFEPPEVYSYISGFDHEYPIIYDGRMMLIALDMYLGPDYPPYEKLGVPMYRIQKFGKEFIVRDCVDQIAHTMMGNREHGRNILDLMVLQGKYLYFLDAILPNTSERIKIKYSKPQQEWAKKNETNLWAFIIENEVLYSTDKNVEKKLLLDAPFTSYFGNESPPRLGEWVGWKIVKRFMQNNPTVTLEDLLKDEDSQGILQKSRYKPEK
ncbi:MAG: hypothetical protein GXO89_13810 [Chlorobi bacterium]|nr:hypothetical protein [Chlorobiota bacterium]